MTEPLTVSRDELLPALTRRDPAILGAVLDLQTGRVRTLFDPVRSGRDNAALEALLDREPDRYARVPDYDREYRLMCRYAAEVEDDGLAEALDAALTGEGAFRAFQRTIADRGASEGWSLYRERALRQFVEDWLATLGVQVAWDPPVPVERRAGPGAGLVAALALGTPAASGADPEVLVRRLDLRSPPDAQRVLEQAARELCELGGVPFRRAFLRGRDRFERDGVVLERDGATLWVRVRRVPAWADLLR